MYGRNQKVVVEEESSEEVDVEESLNVAEDSELFVASPDVPVLDALLTFGSPEIVRNESHFLLNPETKSDSGDIREKDITNDMVPPALSEVRKDVLP